MRARKRSELPASLSRLEQRFSSWRSTRASGERIPERLWKSAVKSAAAHGLNRTARVLNLDYYSLKKRVEDASSRGESSTFVELTPSSLPMVSECVIELEDAAGSRMRVQVKGLNLPDVLTLSRDFWKAD
jgi:hypothetical protein